MTRALPRLSCQTRHAIILAAGESTRTRPLTFHRPKPLIPLVGQPLLSHILDELVGLIDRVTLVVGYRAEDIRAQFGTSYRGMDVRYVHQHQVNGTAGALLAVAEHAATGAEPSIDLDEPFFVLYGDNLVRQADLLSVCQHHYGLAGLPVDDPTAFGVLEIADDHVQRIIEKPATAPPGALANPGIYHFDAQVFSALRHIQPSPRGEYELTDLIAMLAHEHRVGYSLCTYWIPVGNPWEVLIASAALLKQRAALPPLLLPETPIQDCEIIGSVHIGHAHLGPGCRIIGPAYIGDDVVIGAGCTINQSVLEWGAEVGDNCSIEHSMLGVNVQLGADCVVQYSLIDGAASILDTFCRVEKRPASLGAGAHLPARLFDALKPVAHTAGLLDREAMCWRGSVVGAGVTVPPGTMIEPGSVLFP